MIAPPWALLCASASIALGDMDGIVHPEIVASSWETDELYVFDELGNVLPGWPVQLSAQNWSSPAIGDLDNDGDLTALPDAGESRADAKVLAFSLDGPAPSQRLAGVVLEPSERLRLHSPR